MDAEDKGSHGAIVSVRAFALNVEAASKTQKYFIDPVPSR